MKKYNAGPAMIVFATSAATLTIASLYYRYFEFFGKVQMAAMIFNMSLVIAAIVWSISGIFASFKRRRLVDFSLYSVALVIFAQYI